uniref:Uncharacterized protein n=1 Tax=Candidozyma auris TaxID=498019 RepID=A0A0L0P3F1_CANAR
MLQAGRCFFWMGVRNLDEGNMVTIWEQYGDNGDRLNYCCVACFPRDGRYIRSPDGPIFLVGFVKIPYLTLKLATNFFIGDSRKCRVRLDANGLVERLLLPI